MIRYVGWQKSLISLCFIVHSFVVLFHLREAVSFSVVFFNFEFEISKKVLFYYTTAPSNCLTVCRMAVWFLQKKLARSFLYPKLFAQSPFFIHFAPPEARK
jgi:hypothetical protein